MPSVSVDGVELNVQEKGSGPAVLLIHGGGIDSRAWGDIFDDLAADHRVIAYDRRGTTGSPHPPIADWSRHADDAAAVLRDREAVPAAVAGWSSGGIVALDLAVRHPDLVSSLVLLESGVHGAKRVTPGLLRAVVRAQVLRRVRGSEAGTEDFMRWLCSFRDGGGVWEEYPEDRKQAVLANGEMFWRGEMRARDGHLTTEKLGQIRIPTTVAHGDRTQSWFVRCAEGVVKKIPTAELRTIPGANHALAYTAPRETAAVIREGAARGEAA